jgi:hypothetical protein
MEINYIKRTDGTRYDLLKFGTIEKKAFSFRLQNN